MTARKQEQVVETPPNPNARHKNRNPRRGTWSTWFDGNAPESVLTRDQVIELLQQQNVTASAEDFKNWQLAGVIPYGERRWSDGATRTLYPVWMPDLIVRLRQLQADGYKLAQITPVLQEYATAMASPESDATDHDDEAPERPRNPPEFYDVLRALQALAKVHAERHGRRVNTIDVAFDNWPQAHRITAHVKDDDDITFTYNAGMSAKAWDETGKEIHLGQG